MNNLLTGLTFTFVRQNSETLERIAWTSDELDLKANVVCGKCNSGWMSKVDNQEAKPVLSDLIPSLRAIQVPIRKSISLAIFAFKTAVVADHMGIHPPFFTREQRHSFASTLSIPGGVFMWLGALEHRRSGAFKTRRVVPANSTKDDFLLYCFTYTVGHFVLQVVGIKWVTHSSERMPFPIIEQNPHDKRFMTPFWPNVASLRWPPDTCLPSDSIDELANRWGKLNLMKGSAV